MWILPTLSRPAQCAAVVSQMIRMDCSTGLVVCVNGNHAEYKEAFRNILTPSLVRYEDTNIGALGALNKLFELYPNEKFYGFIADDEFVMTPGFDKRLIEAAGDWNISHGNDQIQDGKRAQGYVCIGGKLARAAGYLALKDCWHWCGFDQMWETIAAAKGCEKNYCEDVIVEHRHPYMNKGEMDDCYRLGESRKAEDVLAFRKWMYAEQGGLADVLNNIRKAKAGG